MHDTQVLKNSSRNCRLFLGENFLGEKFKNW
jgi:hypothetical protein